MKITDLKPDGKNANKGTAKGAKLIAASLKEYGAGRSILIDKNNRIIAGNKTSENALAAGMEDVIVVDSDGTKLIAVRRTDLDLETDTAAKELGIADNRAGQVSLEWDTDLLQELDVDLSKFWAEDELAALFKVEKIPPALLGDEDVSPDAPSTAATKPGDVYVLGDHRLMCGDSTNPQHVNTLMDGEKADMVFTDPPYGIDYQDTKGNHGKIAGDASLANVESLLTFVLTNDCPMFICCNWKSYAAFEAAMIAAGRTPKACIVWDKKVRIQNLDRFFKQHEFIIYSGPFGGQPTVDGDVWQCDREVRSDHPTAKPVELIERALMHTSSSGSIVQDLFGGSGSTLIACEKTGRRARMMELDPAYCDVIVARWELATGKKAQLLSRTGTP